MRTSFRPNRRTPAVIAALLLVLVLAGSLAGRLPASAAPEIGAPSLPAASGPAPQAVVPAPEEIRPEAIPAPACWSCPTIPPVTRRDFSLDLDLLAPLGDGPGNAATWLRMFAKHDGPRAAGWSEDLVEHDRAAGGRWRVLPGDHPILLEAEGWVDQARCRFYPDVWELRGADTPVANLLFALTLARSWVARGTEAEDPEAAGADFRRAVRLGRLLRQDDVVVIQDLVGLAAIHAGAGALYRQARREGDAGTMLVAARVLAEKDALRLLTSAHLATVTRVLGSLERGWFGGVSLSVDDGDVNALQILATGGDRRFVMEALNALQLVSRLADAEPRRAARETLETLAASADPLIGPEADRLLDERLDDAEIVRRYGLEGPGASH